MPSPGGSACHASVRSFSRDRGRGVMRTDRLQDARRWPRSSRARFRPRRCPSRREPVGLLAPHGAAGLAENPVQLLSVRVPGPGARDAREGALDQ